MEAAAALVEIQEETMTLVDTLTAALHKTQNWRTHSQILTTETGR